MLTSDQNSKLLPIHRSTCKTCNEAEYSESESTYQTRISENHGGDIHKDKVRNVQIDIDQK